MKKLLIPFFASALLLSGCLENDDPKPFFYGLATVETPLFSSGGLKFHSDRDNEGKWYTYVALNDIDPKNQLNDGDRVFMSCTIEKDNMDRTYDATVTSSSRDIAKAVEIKPVAPEKLVEVFLEIPEVNGGYISTDKLGRQFLNLMVNYATKKENEDSIVIGYFDEDQDPTKPETVVLRIKHYQKDKVSSSSNVNDIVSIKLWTIPSGIGNSVAPNTYICKYMGNGDVEKTTKEFKINGAQ